MFISTSIDMQILDHEIPSRAVGKATISKSIMTLKKIVARRKIKIPELQPAANKNE